jgi:hypothetical protein
MNCSFLSGKSVDSCTKRGRARFLRLSNSRTARGWYAEEEKMKRLLLAATSLLAVATLGSTGHAQRFEFTYTGTLVNFTVPINGMYQIVAFGAQGGNSGVPGGTGGRGAEIAGDFSLTAGETLQIAVGGAGMAGGGGGGGTFVISPDKGPLVIAGAGGGGAGQNAGGVGGIDQGGGTGGGISGGSGGSAGNGGQGGGSGGGGGTLGFLGGGGGGGGFFSTGGNGIGLGAGGGGGSFPDLAGGSAGSAPSLDISGADGGFGGGGGGAADPGGGGGGGFSGGGGGTRSLAGGGGGSYDAGTDQILVAGVWTGNGEVIINLFSPVFAGTPGKANCHGKSVSALARQFGGLKRAAEALGYASVDALQNAIMEFCEG